jgi:hypothetical protein
MKIGQSVCYTDALGICHFGTVAHPNDDADARALRARGYIRLQMKVCADIRCEPTTVFPAVPARSVEAWPLPFHQQALAADERPPLRSASALRRAAREEAHEAQLRALGDESLEQVFGDAELAGVA